MSKKVIVFGGSGFIGGYVVNELLKRNYNVVVADLNPSKYIPLEIFRKCDILDRIAVKQLIEDNKVNFVYNFAGFANLDDAVKNPLKTVELNIMGNMNILEACRGENIDRFIYASSAYAVSNKGSFYGISKLSSEKLIEEYYKKFGLKFTILRYGSVYGDRDYCNNYLYNLLKTVFKTKKIIHFGDGEEIREYIHAEDAARLSVDIIESKKFVNEHLILTGIERMRRKELFEMIKEIMGSDIEIIFEKDDYYDHYKYTPYSFVPQRSKKLVANPHIDMGQGIIDCLSDIEKNGIDDE